MLTAALIGFCFGFFGSIPVAGPIAALVLKRGLTGRFQSAALVGAGGAIAEAVYAFLAFWGFAKYLTQYPIIEPISRGVAAVILIGLGVSFARYRGARNAVERQGTDSAIGSALLGFTITALNPTLIATWTAATSTLYSTNIIQFTPNLAIPFSLGALVGISGWFSLLVGMLRRYRGRFDQQRLDTIVRVIGVAIIGLGVWFLVRFISYFSGSH